MPDIREYLLDRFMTDAATLRQRANLLKGVTKPSPGPNAALSTAMADACDHVIALTEQLPEHASVDVMLDALTLLVPKLMQLADAPQLATSPAIRSVYIGACTRAHELIAAESSAASANRANGLSSGFDEAETFGDDLGDDDGIDDADVDDDDLYDEDQDEEHKE
ncbi:MAG: hypothetical protein ABI120_01170 [Gemmatimonadaceae bacterium]